MVLKYVGYINMDTNYLIHYGIKGMKWGVRRKEAIQIAKESHREAKQEYKSARSAYVKSVLTSKPKDQKRELRSQLATANTNRVEAKATLAGVKRNSVKSADRAYAKTYSKEMNKIGSVGSRRDKRSAGASTKLYDKLTQEKGKEFADRIAHQVKAKQTVKQIADTATIVMAGASLVAGIFGVGAAVKSIKNKVTNDKNKDITTLEKEIRKLQDDLDDMDMW